MSRYVLTQEQLDRLQEQIQQLSHLNDAKQERIRELELHKARVSDADAANLIKTIGILENEIRELKRANEHLQARVSIGNETAARIYELERLLEEERKLRKYSETFAKQVELKCAEESLIRELTTELCQLQKAEIEIDNKRIEDLQKKLDSIKDANPHERFEKEAKQILNSWSKENFFKNKQLQFITEQLKRQLTDLHREIENNPDKTKEDLKKVREVERWMKEAQLLTLDLNNIESLKKDLKYMRNEIENRKQSTSKYNT